jgi:putative phage-type endonuclease
MIDTLPAAETILTLDEADETTWLEARRAGITGSDCLAVLGADPMKSRLAVYLDKAEGLSLVEETEAMRFGRKLESVVAAEFAERTGLTVTDPRMLYRSRAWPFMLATPDRFVTDHDGRVGVLELKTTSAWLAKDWKDGDVPNRALAQTMHYLAVTGLDYAYLAALIGGNTFRHVYIERDADLIATIVDQEKRFWFGYVDAGIMPAADASQSTTDALNALYPAHIDDTAVEFDDQLHDVYHEYIAAKAEESLIGTRVKALANRLRAAIGRNEQATYNGAPILGYKAHTQARLDVDALRKAHPHIAAEFTATSLVRPLRILKGGE